jgi:hypothetical protein
MVDSVFRRAFVALCVAAALLVVLASCSLDSADLGQSEQSGAVRGGSKSWKPSTAPDSGKSEHKIDASSAQVKVHDASVADARARNEDDLDAGASPASAPAMTMAMTNPPPMGGSGACATGGGGGTEVCNTLDDDCDKKVDEDCECPSAEPVACYDGPSGTLGVGSCRAGTRSCAAGALGPCLGAVLPSGETCNEIDDDCNGEVDDLPSLVEDKENCGRCGTVCAGNESCCNGSCVNPRGEDVQNCGACGTVCSAGTLPGCCGGRCVDLLSDPTCGNCDNACGLLKLGGGFVCSCTMTETEGPQCVAQMDSNEWLCQ